MEKAVWIWLAAALIFIIVEIFSPGFIFACFVVGAIGAAVTSLFTDSYLIQGAVFAVVSLILIPLTRPLANRITKESPVKSNMDAFIGKIGIVKKEVSDTAGQIHIDEQIWQARSTGIIAVDTRVRVTGFEGARLFVEAVSE